ncbi:hypothetical protein ACUX65_25620, partial [Salmonella enterica]
MEALVDLLLSLPEHRGMSFILFAESVLCQVLVLKILNYSARGMRASNHPQSAGLACQNGPAKQNPDAVSSTLPFSSAVSNTN